MKKKLSVILSFVILFLVGFIPSKGVSRALWDQPEVDSLPIRRSVELTSDAQKQLHLYNNIKGADSLYRLSIVEDSTYAPAYYGLAQIFSALRGPIDSTLLYSRRAFLLDTLNKWYGEMYAQNLAVTGDYDAARAMYRLSIEREPQNPNSYIMVAMLYSGQRQYAQALAVIDSAELRTGKNSYLSTFKRELLVATGQHEKAIADTKEIIAIDPEEVESRLDLAELYIMTKQDSLAQREYEAALQIDSTSLEVLTTLSQFYAQRENTRGYFSTVGLIFANMSQSLDAKISIFEDITSDRKFYARNHIFIGRLASKLYRLYPLEPDVVKLYAQHLIDRGELDEALALYKRHRTDRPAQYDYYSLIIDIESFRQRPDSVEMYAAEAIELFPERHSLRLSMANLYSYTKRYEKALSEYLDVVERIPSDSLKSSVWGSVGSIYNLLAEQQPNSRKAKSLMRKSYKAYDKALSLDPDNSLVLNNYAYFLSLEQRDLELALKMASRAVELSGNNPTYLDTYAWVLYHMGDFEQAKKIMRQVIALDTTSSADIQFHYGEILSALGENFMAEIYYDKALKLGYDATIIQERKDKLK